MSTYYWWAKNPSFLPWPDSRCSLKRIFNYSSRRNLGSYIPPLAHDELFCPVNTILNIEEYEGYEPYHFKEKATSKEGEGGKEERRKKEKGHERKKGIIKLIASRWSILQSRGSTSNCFRQNYISLVQISVGFTLKDQLARKSI